MSANINMLQLFGAMRACAVYNLHRVRGMEMLYSIS